MTPEQFQSQFMPYAQQVSDRTGLDPRLVLAQAALETGWGRSAPNNNYFGIKSHGQSGGSTLMTQEFQNGQMVSMPQSFRGYETPEASFQGYADFILSNPRYRRVLSQPDIGGQIEAMGNSGYATDPEYAAKLSSIAERFGADTPRAVAGDTRAALGMSGQGAQPQFSTRGPDQMMPPRERPQGLLQTLGVQPQGEGPQGDRPFYQRDRFKDLMGGIALAANTLRQRPDQNIPAVVGQARQAREANRTAEWLAQQEGGAEFAQMIQSGGNPAEALMAYRQSRQPAQTFRQVRGSELGMTGESANALFNVGPDGKISAIGGAATNINLPAGVQVAGDYVIVPDQSAPGGVRQVLIEGSETARAMAAAEAAEAARAGNANELAERKDTVVSGSIDTLIGMIDKGGIFDLPETGIVGNLLGSLGVNQEAVDFRNELSSVQANIAFDRLNEMREASKNGAALGSVSERELDLLMNAYGNINQSTSPKRLRENLQTIKEIMTKIENDPIASAAYAGQPLPSAATGSTASGVTPPAGALDMLRSNPTPTAQAQFDEIFGAGAAARALGQ